MLLTIGALEHMQLTKVTPQNQVPDLKMELKNWGLSTKGNKPDLVQRLISGRIHHNSVMNGAARLQPTPHCTGVPQPRRNPEACFVLWRELWLLNGRTGTWRACANMRSSLPALTGPANDGQAVPLRALSHRRRRLR